MISRILYFFIFFIFINQAQAKDDIMIMKLKDGEVLIELYNDVAPNHVKRFKQLSKEKKYDGLFFIELYLVLWLKPVMLNLVIQTQKIMT